MKHCCGTRILLQDVVTVNSAGIIDQWLLTPFEIRQKRFKSAMKSWRDEWKSARLHLRLRAHQLFHGESVTLLVYVEPAADARDGHAELQEATVRRWQTRCDGARADVKVVVDDSAGRRRESSGASPHPSATPRHGPRATLSHQETELAVARGEVGGDAHGAHPPERYLLALKAEFELKVRSEFWDRPLSLVVRITPKDLVADMVGSTRDAMSSAAPEDGALTDEWFADRLLPLIREDSTPPASLTKRLEYAVKVVNPLQVQVETRALTLGRVGITVKAHNTRDDVVVEVLDLQLHMSEALTVTTSTLSKDEQKPSIGRYELVDDAKTPFPVQLLAQERYNFLFVLAPTQPTIKEHEMSESSENAAPTQLQHERSRGFGGGTAGHDAGPEHALLTLTWRTKGTAVQAITEQHSVIWSPFALSGSDAGATPSTLSASEWGHLVVPQSWAGEGKPLTASSLAFEALRHDSALQVTVTPPAAGARVGEVSTACVAIANRSRRSTFDLTLVVPSGGSAWASFEASHHLGLVRPGKSVRKSVHLCALRAGAQARPPLPLALVDARTRTCFVSEGPMQ